MYNNASKTHLDEGPKIIGIPPNVIKNLNVFEVLEPIKVNTANEALLIDLNDSSASDKKRSETKGFDLIDVYENILVTPQLVSKKPNEDEDLKPKTHIDYEDFFRKWESGKKVDWGQNTANHFTEKQNEQYQTEFDNTFDRLASKDERPTYNGATGNYAESYNAVDHEDLIDELLSSKNLAKIKISKEYPMGIDPSPVTSSTRNITPIPSVLKEDTTQKLQNVRLLSSPNKYPDTMAYSTVQNEYIKCMHSPQGFQDLNSSKTQSHKSNLSSFHKEKLEYMHSNIKENKPENMATTSPHDRKQDSPFNNLNYEDLLASQANIQRGSFIKGSKLDADTMLHIFKTLDCTDFNINTSQDRSSIPKNYARDNLATSSVSSDVDNSKFPSYSPTLDCKKNNLASLKSIIKEGKTNNSLKNTNTLALINKTINPEILSTMSLQAIVKDNKAFKNNNDIKSDVEKLNYTKGPNFHVKSILLPQLLDRLGAQKKAMDEKNNVKRRLMLDAGTKKSVEIPVKLEPTVLMEDCNRERLLDWKTRKMMENFVKDGRILH